MVVKSAPAHKCICLRVCNVVDKKHRLLAKRIVPKDLYAASDIFFVRVAKKKTFCLLPSYLPISILFLFFTKGFHGPIALKCDQSNGLYILGLEKLKRIKYF